ncbi:hypothetical protein [Gemmatimonas sp.]|uniref:hypothetical protein n=1 Tax=Gemmatimonas sp. TaxID=1962908 RepID=UPI003DA2CD5D
MSARFVIVAALLLTACSTPAEDPAAAAARAQAAHVQAVIAAGGTVDSILPIAVHLERFRAGLPRADTLASASPSIEALAQRLAAALQSRDTVAMNAMVLSRAEFAYLFYPESAMSKPPYEAPPELLWGQILASSDDGAGKLLARFGGTPVRIRALRCPDAPEQEGANRLHKRCEAELTAPGVTSLKGNVFGTILERNGQFKFVGFANRV